MGKSDDYRRFGDNWARNTRLAHSLAGDRFIVIRYEEFIANPEPVFQKIETLTGIPGIDRSVMTRRINANPLTDRDAQNSDDYRKPSELSPAEIDLLMSDARDTYTKLRYVP